jgi:hypothetical protein
MFDGKEKILSIHPQVSQSIIGLTTLEVNTLLPVFETLNTRFRD